MSVTDYDKAMKVTTEATEESLFDLEDADGQVLHQIKIVEIRQKCRNIGPIYTPKPIQKATENLNKYRQKREIEDEYTFLFAVGKGS